MSTRHHTTGQFAARGRQPRTEHKPVARAGKPSAANAQFNADMARANKPAGKATPGQIVASTKTN
jgi:hypothetical protein